MSGSITLRFLKSTPRFHVYTPEGGEGEGVGNLYIAKAMMNGGAEPRVRVNWPEPPESGR